MKGEHSMMTSHYIPQHHFMHLSSLEKSAALQTEPSTHRAQSPQIAPLRGQCVIDSIQFI